MSCSFLVHLAWLRGHVERDVIPRLQCADTATRSIWARRLRGAADGRRTLPVAAFRVMYLELFAAVDLVCPLKGHHRVVQPHGTQSALPSHYPGWVFDFDLVDPSADAQAAYRARIQQQQRADDDHNL